MSDGWLGFFGGIVATLVAALIASIVQRRHEAAIKKQQTQLHAYFHLIELSNQYFWVASAEIHGESPPQEVLGRCRELALQLSDKLRAFDNVEHLEEILTLLFSESIPTANERADRLNLLIEKYGKLVNPKYSAIVTRIARQNLLRHGPGPTPSINAPASWRYVK